MHAGSLYATDGNGKEILAQRPGRGGRSPSRGCGGNGRPAADGTGGPWGNPPPGANAQAGTCPAGGVVLHEPDRRDAGRIAVAGAVRGDERLDDAQFQWIADPHG